MTGMDSKEVLDALTDEQRAPVLARGANILLQAAPGSGKTRVIIARCISLLDDGADPSKLLLLTFSRRAVGELRDRLKGALGVASALPDVRTFHGFASRLLSVEGPTFRNRRLLSEPANKTLFAEAVARTALRAFPSGVAQSQAFLREAGTRVDELRRAGDAAIAEIEAGASPRLQDLIAIHRSVQTLRDELRVADYNDLVGRALALAGDPSSSVHRWLNGRYEHLLVDEFQDTDPLQLALLQYVGGQIFAVGDSAQAIYGFRGAARDALERAESVLQMRSFSLGQSFRCPQAVCALASATPNLSRAMTLESRSDMPGNITVRRAATTLDEAALVANEVRQARDAGVEPGEIAVLLRASEPLAPLIAQELQRRGIPTAQLGGDALVNDDAVSVVLSALRVFANPSNAAAWANLLVHPALCFPPLTIRLAFDPARIDSVETGVAAIESARVDGRIQATTLIAALREAYQHWRNDEPVRAARTFARRANILGYVVRCGEDQARISGGRIRRFLDALYDLRDVRHRLGSSVRSAAVFDDFLTQAAHWNEPSDPSRETNAVRILTIHAAKGLEFDSVVVAGAAESHFPQAWRYDSLLDEDDIAYARAHGMDLGLLPAEQIAEESSLWYVAVTRSKRSLVITYSASDADGSPLAPSRFIPLDVLEESKQANPYRADLTYRSVDPASVTLQPGEPVTLERRIPTTGVEKWLTCRRQFFYDVLLRLHDDEKPLNRALGIAI
ncbi:MAG: ATP-dependent helicase, partial [Burkholderiales bacterium]